MKNIDRINLLDRGFCNGPSQRFGADLRFQPFTTPGRQSLGVIQAVDRVIRIEDNRSGNHGPGQRPPSSFVDTTDEAIKPKQRHHCAPVEADY